MIEARGLTKVYGNRAAISDVSFQVQKGEIVGFLGPNGAGKTTTMRILTGYFPPTSGSGTVAGYDIFTDSLKARERIGYLPETPPLYREMSVRAFLEFAARIRGVAKQDLACRVEESISICGLADVTRRLIGNLSKGYRQRVGLAQALIHKPDVLILDEPTAGLDPKQILEIRQLIKSLAGRSTIVLSTHILPEVSQICQRVIVIHQGRIVAMDTIDRLGTSMRETEKVEVTVKRYDEGLEARLREIDGVRHVTAEGEGRERTVLVEVALGSNRREDIARAAVEGRHGLIGLRTVTLSLEDVFLKLTTQEPSDGEGGSHP